MKYQNSRLIEHGQLKSGKITWKSPSNIAIVKYWGKYSDQLPKNPSISFTLNEAYTQTTLIYTPNTNSDQETVDLTFYFHQERNSAFEERIVRYFNKVVPIFPFLRQFSYEIYSENSFPHSSGIASSASAMSALALCLCSLEQKFFGTSAYGADGFFKKASFIARLGSGSAARSVFPSCAVWGETTVVPGSSNYEAIPFFMDIHPVFKTFRDDILILSSAKKQVSSSAGHDLMNGHVFADRRVELAHQHLSSTIEALRTGDLDRFGNILEKEALMLHALMMTSEPAYILMQPNTLLVIQKIWAFRTKHQLPVFFTLDAGPNIHLLYPKAHFREVQVFIESELAPFCEDGLWLKDYVGLGPQQQLHT